MAAFRLLLKYAAKKFLEQLKTVYFITLYLFLLQTLVLKVPVLEGALVSIGLVLVVVGLTFFMEGLLLGIMPLGERVGEKLPQNSKLHTVLAFSFILGLLSTFAEPAVTALRTIGRSVIAWEAPLLFMLLNTHVEYLVYAVGIGVGISVLLGLLRFLYGWSLKPFLYIIVSLLALISAYAYWDPNLQYLIGLAWDCGAITTGAVTVPLVIALGIGVSRVTGKRISDYGVFGIVSLASLIPIITVIIYGIIKLPLAPTPMTAEEFFSSENRHEISMLFSGEEELIGYALNNADYYAQLALFSNESERMHEFLREISRNEMLAEKMFGGHNLFYSWLLEKGTVKQQAAIFQSDEEMQLAIDNYWNERLSSTTFDIVSFMRRNIAVAARAILPLVLLLLVFLFFISREKLPNSDVVALGIVFAFVGMALLRGGLEMGLSNLGDQVGRSLPVVFSEINIPAEMKIIRNFKPDDVIQKSITQDGRIEEFFYMSNNNKYLKVPFKAEHYHKSQNNYHHIPLRGPLFGKISDDMTGIIVVIVLVFIMGFGATLAEPALNALGIAVEEITVGSFKKTVLIQTVAIGVGIGSAAGVIRIIWNIPLFWILIPPYLLLLILTKFSTEEFVNIAWDSAGVTTGLVTVPLVISMGLGIGRQIGAVEGFGILSLASAGSILTVLLMGMYVNRKRKVALSADSDSEEPLITGDTVK